MILDRPDGRWANDCALCSNSRVVGLYPDEHECPWCKSVRLKHGSYWYLITKRTEHLFPRFSVEDAKERINVDDPLRQNAGMAQTSKEKQEAFRARQAMLGMREVRGIYLPEALHPALKERAQKLLEQHTKEDQRG